MAKFTEEQIIHIIEGRPGGVSVKDYCAEVGMKCTPISGPVSYNSKIEELRG